MKENSSAAKSPLILFIITVAVLFVLSLRATAQETRAPFGFDWGISIGEVERITGMKRELDLLWGRVHSVHSKTAPNLPPNTDFISLSVDPKFGLGRILWYSNNIIGDPYGLEGKSKYFDYKDLLSRKYGPPSNSLESVGIKLWDEPDEFYQCLDYDGCGMYLSIWEVSSGLSIALQLNGLRRGEGYFSIVYEGPNWDDIIEAVNKAEAKAAEDSF